MSKYGDADWRLREANVQKNRRGVTTLYLPGDSEAIPRCESLIGGAGFSLQRPWAELEGRVLEEPRLKRKKKGSRVFQV